MIYTVPMKISPNRADTYSEWAREFYNPDLPYHNWHHAEEVMEESETLVNAKGGRWTRHVNRPLLQIAAAWHDAGHDHEERHHYESPEHYSVYLMRQRLQKELSSRHLAIVEESILGTRYQMPRETMAAVALHYADVSNMASQYPGFFDHTKLLWKESGTPEWQTWSRGAQAVIQTTASEAIGELPFIGIDGRQFADVAEQNAARLVQEETPNQ